MRNAPIDMSHIRQATRAGSVRYVQIHNGVITVGTVPIALSQQQVPCLSVLVQSDFANGGTIAVGGPEMTITTGIQLIAGAAYLIYADQGPTPDAVMRSAMGIGLERLTAVSQSGNVGQNVKVISLSHVRAVATAPGQLLRFQWIAWSL